MSVPFLPGATDIAERPFDPQTPVTVGGRTKPLAWWHETARLAQQAGDTEALAAAREAIHKYADQLTQGYQVQRRHEASDATMPSATAAVASHALDAASLGLGAPMRGAVSAAQGKGFAAGERQVADPLAEQEEKQPLASLAGTALGGTALGLGTGAVTGTARFGAPLAERLGSIGRAAGAFGAEGAVRGATHATGGTGGERASAAAKQALTDALLGALAEGSATGLRDRLMRPIKRDQLLAARLGQATRSATPKANVGQGAFEGVGPRPAGAAGQLSETPTNLAEAEAAKGPLWQRPLRALSRAVHGEPAAVEGPPKLGYTPRGGAVEEVAPGVSRSPVREAKPISEGSPGSAQAEQAAPTMPAEAPSRPPATSGGPGGPAGYASHAKISPANPAAGTAGDMLGGVLRIQSRALQILKGPVTREAQQELMTLLGQAPPGNAQLLLRAATPQWQALLSR